MNLRLCLQNNQNKRKLFFQMLIFPCTILKWKKHPYTLCFLIFALKKWVYKFLLDLVEDKNYSPIYWYLLLAIKIHCYSTNNNFINKISKWGSLVTSYPQPPSWFQQDSETEISVHTELVAGQGPEGREPWSKCIWLSCATKVVVVAWSLLQMLGLELGRKASDSRAT